MRTTDVQEVLPAAGTSATEANSGGRNVPARLAALRVRRLRARRQGNVRARGVQPVSDPREDVKEIVERIMDLVFAPADLAPDIRRGLTTTITRYGERARAEALRGAQEHAADAVELLREYRRELLRNSGLSEDGADELADLPESLTRANHVARLSRAIRALAAQPVRSSDLVGGTTAVHDETKK